jgi:hypothetical protein
VGIHGVLELCRAPLHLKDHAFFVRDRGKRLFRSGRVFDLGHSHRRALGEPPAHILVRYNDSAVLAEGHVPADMVAVIVSIHQKAHRLRHDRGDRCLQLVVQRRELAIDHDHAIVTNGDGAVAAKSFQHVGAVAEIGCFYLDLREVRPDR